MDVVLLQDVEKVGLKGDVVSVARGYARNYLLPRRLAEPATPGRLAELRRHEELRARHEAQTVEQAREVATILEGMELRFDRKAGETGSLFGSVTATDIADELWRSRRIRVDRRKIRLPDPIKRVGRYEISVDVFTDVSVDVRTLVVPEGGELPPEEPELPAETASSALDVEARTGGAAPETTAAEGETSPAGPEQESEPAPV
jgi:large subunit ribosomal protein L9